MAVGEDVYCTLVMNDAYLPGAAVLAKSLRDAGTQRKLACMIVQENLRPTSIEELQRLFNYVIPVPPISSPNVAALYLMRRPDLQTTFTKIHLWRFTQFRKIVYVDADVVALRAPDELFDTTEDFAAAPDVGFPSIFNTGVMVLSPDSGTYAALRSMANVGDSFDGADQGLLNQYFEYKKWKLLNFTYNCTPNASYQYEPAYRYFKRNISMVHFIGKDKPWQKGRSAIADASGSYQELLSRWWAVYDRHFKVSPTDYVNGHTEPSSYAVSRGTTSDPASYHQPFSATGYPVESTGPAPPPPASIQTRDVNTMTAEEPFTDPGERSENIDQGRVEPIPTRQARKFSAPHMEWDATRGAPPMESKPEAANFPTETYEFSTDYNPYRAPKIEPRIPEDVNYEIPKPRSEEKLAPMFPWEEREMPKPARRFIEDDPAPAPRISEPEPDPEALPSSSDDSVARSTEPESASPVTPTFNTWDLFNARAKNAWDDDAGIDQYVRALSNHQRNRGNVQTLPIVAPTESGKAKGHVMTPSTEIKAEELIEQVQKRRESLLLTDFPSAVDRPSLPVTPAPVRRSTFWSGEHEGEDAMPPAQGVPKQQDWDPAAQLEQLRRNSLLDIGELKLPDGKSIPDRVMIQALRSQSEAAADAASRDIASLDGTSRSAAVPSPQQSSAADASRAAAKAATTESDRAIEQSATSTVQLGSAGVHAAIAAVPIESEDPRTAAVMIQPTTASNEGTGSAVRLKSSEPSTVTAASQSGKASTESTTSTAQRQIAEAGTAIGATAAGATAAAATMFPPERENDEVQDSAIPRENTDPRVTASVSQSTSSKSGSASTAAWTQLESMGENHAFATLQRESAGTGATTQVFQAGNAGEETKSTTFQRDITDSSTAVSESQQSSGMFGSGGGMFGSGGGLFGSRVGDGASKVGIDFSSWRDDDAIRSGDGGQYTDDLGDVANDDGMLYGESEKIRGHRSRSSEQQSSQSFTGSSWQRSSQTMGDMQAVEPGVDETMRQGLQQSLWQNMQDFGQETMQTSWSSSEEMQVSSPSISEAMQQGLQRSMWSNVQESSFQTTTMEESTETTQQSEETTTNTTSTYINSSST